MNPSLKFDIEKIHDEMLKKEFDCFTLFLNLQFWIVHPQIIHMMLMLELPARIQFVEHFEFF